MQKDNSVEPAANKPAAPDSEKKETIKKKVPAKRTTPGKKSTRKTKSPAKTRTVPKTAGAPKREPAKKTKVSARAESPAKLQRRKQTPKPKTVKTPKTKKTAPLPARFEESGKSLKTDAPEQPVKIERSKKQLTETISSAIHTPIDDFRRPHPAKKIILYLGICLMVLMGLTILTSYQNMNKYFIASRHGAVEIWKGKFSPNDRKRIVIMPGMQPPEQTKAFYTKEEVFPLAFQYYIQKADALMEVPGMPDFVGIKSYLNRALSYATTDALRNTAKARINNIDLMILLYKADVAAGKGTLAGLDAATKYLDQASALDPDEIEAKLIRQKLESIQKLKEALSPKPPKTQKKNAAAAKAQ
jgi:hypothetical protein